MTPRLPFKKLLIELDEVPTKGENGKYWKQYSILFGQIIFCVWFYSFKVRNSKLFFVDKKVIGKSTVFPFLSFCGVANPKFLKWLSTKEFIYELIEWNTELSCIYKVLRPLITDVYTYFIFLLWFTNNCVSFVWVTVTEQKTSFSMICNTIRLLIEVWLVIKIGFLFWTDFF